MGRVFIPGFRKIETSSSGEGGTTNYEDLTNKPSINNVPLVGNLNTVDLKLTDATLTEEGVPAEAKTVGTKLEEQSTSLTVIKEELTKKANISDIPTKVSELQNDSNYQTDTDVTNTLTTYATKTYVGEQISSVDHLKREIVTEIPSPETADKNTIYMLKIESAMGDDKYREYLLIDGTVQCIGDTSVDLTDYAKKTEIPTELPANGGNSLTVNGHTVETNVPADAVFTDTVYDDTEVKGSIAELNSNLDTLEYSDIAGGKNLFNPKCLINATYDEKTDTINVTGNTEKALDMVFKENTQYTFSAYVKQGSSDTNIRLNVIYTDGTYNGELLFTKSTSEVYISEKSDSGKTISEVQWYYGSYGTATLRNFKIEEGTTATPYEPYIPSVKMLAEEVNQQNESLSVIGKCKNLLKPTLQTTTKNGVTITNNGDGTYTLNGTATDGTFFDINKNISINKGTKYKSVCFKDEDYVPNKIMSCVRRVDIENGYVSNNGSFVSDTENCWLWIKIEKDVTVSNLVAKPMITTDLNATYDDFVPYTGDGETLTHDVAKLNDSLGAYDINENATNSYSKSNGFAIEWLKMCKATKGTYKLSYTINGSTGGSSEIALGKSINDKTLYRNIGLISDGIYEQIIDITSDTDIYIMVYTNGSITISNIKFTLQNIANEVGNLKNDLVPKKIELQNVDERVTIKDNGSFIIN